MCVFCFQDCTLVRLTLDSADLDRSSGSALLVAATTMRAEADANNKLCMRMELSGGAYRDVGTQLVEATGPSTPVHDYPDRFLKCILES